MEQSILKSTKKVLNVSPEDTSFDQDIITHINSAFFHLHQLGVGPIGGFQIEDDVPTWEDFLPGDEDMLLRNAVKNNVALRVRGLFDPPQLAHVLTAQQQLLQESDWRINVLREASTWIDPAIADVVVLDGGGPELLDPIDGGLSEGDF